MSDGGTLLVLGAGAMQVPLYLKARELGLRVAGADPKPGAPGLAYADVQWIGDLGRVDELVIFARAHGVRGVLTGAADFPVPTVAALCRELGLCGLSIDAARRSTHKGDMAGAFKAAGVPCPDTRVCRNVEDARQAIASLTGPHILKPCLSSGSRGVTQLMQGHSDEALARAVEHALRSGRGGEFLVQTCISGREVSVEVLTRGGIAHVLAITDKITSGAPHHVETGHVQPARFEAPALDNIRATTIAAIKALGIDNAASHVEIMVSPAGPRVIEVGARLGGDYITADLTPLSTGIDMTLQAVRLAMGWELDLRPQAQPQGAAIRFIAPTGGTITSMADVEEVRRMPGIRRLILEAGVGDRVGPITESAARLGHILAVGAGPGEALARANEALEALRLVTTP